MQINLSEEMVQNILEVSFGRISSLRYSIKTLEDWLVNYSSIKSESEIRRKKVRLADLNEQLNKAIAVHELFGGLGN